MASFGSATHAVLEGAPGLGTSQEAEKRCPRLSGLLLPWRPNVRGRQPGRGREGAPGKDGTAEKIYAAALPALKYDTDSKYVPLDSVDLKFVTNFRIETVTTIRVRAFSDSWKEITLDNLQRLVHFIRPVRNEIHPLVNDYGSLNTLRLDSRSQWINGKILSMRLPVESVTLWDVKSYEFFETAGTLYHVDYRGPTLKQSAIDALIEKFVPIDGGSFHVDEELSEEQMKKLFEKCALANREVSVMFILQNSTTMFDSTDPINYDKYYSERKVLEEGNEVLFGKEDKKKLELQICRWNMLWLKWTWSKERLSS
uniref:FBA_2 domain-containing protein n=1 Tax=Steinernema glaseri TaxID=37863 RepID=A0A1I7Y7S7_9BILA